MEDLVAGTWKCTLRASLSGSFLQTPPELVTPLKGHSLSPRRQTDRDTQRNTARDRDRNRERQRDTERDRDTATGRQTDRERERDRQKEKQRERERVRETDRVREFIIHYTSPLQLHIALMQTSSFSVYLCCQHRPLHSMFPLSCKSL